MNKIRDFLCGMNSIAASIVIVVGGLLLAELYVLGFGKFFAIIGIGLVFALTLVAIGYGIYRAIEYFQEGCRLRRW